MTLANIPNPKLLIYPFDRVVSRLNYKPDLFSFAPAAEPIADLVKLPRPRATWSEICQARAQELLKLNRRHYYLGYSGGIDSTGMLVAILQTWPTQDLDRVTVLMTHHSILENPSFFNQHIAKLKFKTWFQDVSKRLLEEDALLITGELGDQLFGSDLIMGAIQFFGDSSPSRPFSVIPEFLNHKLQHKGEEVGSAVFEHFLPIAEESPFPLRTVHDFLWWLNFTQKWQHVKLRYFELKSWDLNATYGKHYVTFYDTVDFQLWSLHNHDLKIRDTWSSYKFTIKEFIYDFTKDPDHLKMFKLQSLMKTYVATEKRVAVTEAYEVLDRIEGLEPYVRH